MEENKEKIKIKQKANRRLKEIIIHNWVKDQTKGLKKLLNDRCNQKK